jgi:hypothetical protein
MNLTIRPARHEELETLFLLSSLSIATKIKNEDSIDLGATRQTYQSFSKALFEDCYKSDNEILMVAEAPIFNPQYSYLISDKKQLCGFSSIRFINQDLVLDDLYSVCSPYRTGTILMSHVIKTAMIYGSDYIETIAAFEETAPWYAQKAMFQYANPKLKSGDIGTMVLQKNDFNYSLSRLNHSNCPPFRKNSLDSPRLFP